MQTDIIIVILQHKYIKLRYIIRKYYYFNNGIKITSSLVKLAAGNIL